MPESIHCPPLPQHPAQPNYAPPQQAYPPQYPAYTPPQPPGQAQYTQAATIRNQVNLKKTSLLVAPCTDKPGFLSLSFRFDASTACRSGPPPHTHACALPIHARFQSPNPDRSPVDPNNRLVVFINAREEAGSCKITATGSPPTAINYERGVSGPMAAAQQAGSCMGWPQCMPTTN